MKKILDFAVTFFCFLLLMLFVCTVSLAENSTDIYGSILRLHVIASSDSKDDQLLKLEVRDRILEKAGNLFSDANSIESALLTAHENKNLIIKAAKDVIREKGRNDTVKVEIGKKFYPEKNYSGIIFPEGEYLSVRVIIGKGKGQNWWCVLYPPIFGSGIEYIPSITDNTEKSAEIEKLAENGGITLFGSIVKLKFLEYLK